MQAAGRISEAKHSLAGLELAIDPGGAHGGGKPILISHGLPSGISAHSARSGS
jgi:hypothetical protein